MEKINMETKFYMRNFIFGQLYVIISATENQTDFIAEKIIIFVEGLNGPIITLSQRIEYPKIPNYPYSLEDFISWQVQDCESAIFYEILFKKYKSVLEQYCYNINTKLSEANKSLIISLLRDKFPAILTNIENNTINKNLKELIGLYKSIIEQKGEWLPLIGECT